MLPEQFWTDPFMYQSCSAMRLVPPADIVMPDESWGVDFESEVAAVTDTVSVGADAETAARVIRLIMI